MPAEGAPTNLEGVRTPGEPSLVGSPCPVCRERPLAGRQSVCSPRCRARRWRAQVGDRRLAAVRRDDEIRSLLETALAKLREGGS
jgi:hypothetical protein